MATILLTGFAPFSGKKTNPSWEAIKDLPDRYAGTHRVVKVELPVTWEGAGEMLERVAQECKADAILSFGLSGAVSNLLFETQAFNYGGNYADEDGLKWDRPYIPDPKAPSRVTPSITYTQAQNWIGSTATLDQSTNAGAFICESVLYRLGAKFPKIPHLFVHFPADSGNSEFSSYQGKMPLSTMRAAVVLLVQGVFQNLLGVGYTPWGDRSILPTPTLTVMRPDPPRNFWPSATTDTIMFSTFARFSSVPPVAGLQIPTSETPVSLPEDVLTGRCYSASGEPLHASTTVMARTWRTYYGSDGLLQIKLNKVGDYTFPLRFELYGVTTGGYRFVQRFHLHYDRDATGVIPPTQLGVYRTSVELLV
ncbi:hypothetical protein [Corynebacterium heidelbergense]|uniref:Pyrrolidone-carboxylate peptidase n=1 Tax=Corynebacterium heidelbergense TaxID=2055947 RepID=A0A364VE58_9CORY|nr:hypothetical protein [Corynebacterium heidelbergense]RAV34935.1 hypothetical protein CWC39_00935 [Corynebacterium heidelbergense]WCZ36073.1 Pyrrolidone-carboxylate peptidase [Corynebacterium heidelbergense]